MIVKTIKRYKDTVFDRMIEIGEELTVSDTRGRLLIRRGVAVIPPEETPTGTPSDVTPPDPPEDTPTGATPDEVPNEGLPQTPDPPEDTPTGAPRKRKPKE